MLVMFCDDGDFVNHSVLFVGISRDVVDINWGSFVLNNGDYEYKYWIYSMGHYFWQ